MVACAADAARFSLPASGVLDRQGCRLLVVGGTEGSIFPIKGDLIVGLSRHGKDLVARGDWPHMGDAGAEDVLCEWIDRALAQTP